MEPRVPGMGGLSGEIVLHRVIIKSSKFNAIYAAIWLKRYNMFKINYVHLIRNLSGFGAV
jgi:hypothetical protein